MLPRQRQEDGSRGSRASSSNMVATPTPGTEPLKCRAATACTRRLPNRSNVRLLVPAVAARYLCRWFRGSELRTCPTCERVTPGYPPNAAAAATPSARREWDVLFGLAHPSAPTPTDDASVDRCVRGTENVPKDARALRGPQHSSLRSSRLRVRRLHPCVQAENGVHALPNSNRIES